MGCFHSIIDLARFIYESRERAAYGKVTTTWESLPRHIKRVEVKVAKDLTEHCMGFGTFFDEETYQIVKKVEERKDLSFRMGLSGTD